VKAFLGRKLFQLLATAVFIHSFFSLPGAAQEYAKQEVTLGLDFQSYGVGTCDLIGNGPECSPGVDHYLSPPAPSVTYTWNLSPSLALEGTVSPTSVFRKTNEYGSGRELLAMGGVKTGWRGRKWGIYGEVLAGVGSFSCGYYIYDPAPYSDCARVTNFALEYGGTVERRINKRWALRLDAGDLMMPEFDRILTRYSSGLSEYSQESEWLQHFNARVGVARSFGALRSAEKEPVPKQATWDAGVLFSLQPRDMPEYTFMNAYPGVGIWGSWNFSKHFSWDTSVLHTGRNSGWAFADFQAGGRSLEALTGLKAGIRRDHMGYFAKLRGGTMTFGETDRQFNEVSPGVFKFDRGMFTNAAMDIGAVLEVYPSRHTIFRCDAGSTTIFYLPKNAIQMGQSYSIPGQHQTGMLMTFGAGFRF
jgi:hypothetical protein